MNTDRIMTEIFGRPRDPRSPEYKAGGRAALDFRLNGIKIKCPYRVGSAAADAFFSGLDEGHQEGRSRISKEIL